MLKFISRVLAFAQAENCFPRSKNKTFITIIFDNIVTNRLVIHSGEVIDRAKFDASTHWSFGGVKAYEPTYTDRTLLCIHDNKVATYLQIK